MKLLIGILIVLSGSPFAQNQNQNQNSEANLNPFNSGSNPFKSGSNPFPKKAREDDNDPYYEIKSNAGMSNFDRLGDLERELNTIYERINALEGKISSLESKIDAQEREKDAASETGETSE